LLLCGTAGHLGTACFLNPSNPNNRLPDKLREKYMVDSSDRKEQKPKKLNQESIDIVAMACSTVPKAEQTTIIPPKDSRCYLDSGASCSTFFSRHTFVPGALHVCDPRPILLADTYEISANMSGDVILEFPKEDGSPTVILRITSCWYVEDLGYNLISVGKLANKGITSIFRAETGELKIEPKNLILGIRIRDRKGSSLYVLPSKQYEHTLVSVNNKNDMRIWHKRMTHMNRHDLRQAHKYSDDPKFSDVVHNGICSPCHEGKATKLPFRGNFEHADEVGEIIDREMAGKLPVSFPDRIQYITTFTDDNSRHMRVVFMQRKSQSPQAVTAFHRELQVLAKRKLEMRETHTSNNDDF
jgi:hypothetical protein